MRRIHATYLFAAASTLVVGVAASQAQSAKPAPLVIPLECPGGDCPLLSGAPQTAGLHSGHVRLKPGASVGWHTTGSHEEELVILRGKGRASIGGETSVTFTAPAVVYIPPETRHDVTNSGVETLEYVYVVAPVKTQ